MNAWGNAIRCLKPEGGFLHIHMNVHEDEIEEWTKKQQNGLQLPLARLLKFHYLEVVKKYSPRIMHVVLDLKLV